MERIISNKIQCKHCGENVESKSIHEFVTCKCGACSVDGGTLSFESFFYKKSRRRLYRTK